MMWQERQNVVLSERCNSFSMPATREKSGRKKSTPNARIFPARLMVIAGRTTTTPARTALNRTRITMATVGIELAKSNGFSLLQAADVSDEILDLLRLQAFAGRRHFAFAVTDDCGDLIVTLLLYILRTEIPDLVGLPDRGFTLSVGAMTGHAFPFIESLPAGLPPRRHRENTKRRAKQEAQDSLAHSLSIHISSRKDLSQDSKRISHRKCVQIAPEIPRRKNILHRFSANRPQGGIFMVTVVIPERFSCPRLREMVFEPPVGVQPFLIERTVHLVGNQFLRIEPQLRAAGAGEVGT